MTVRRLSVEDWNEPTFIDSFSATGHNIRAAREWLEIELEIASLHYKFELTSDLRDAIFKPPDMVRDFELRKRYSGGALSSDWPFAKEAGLAFFNLSNGRPANAEWADLTVAQKRKANSMAAQFLTEDRVSAKGRNIATNIPLLLYLIFLIEEFLIKRRFPMSRPEKAIAGALAGKRPPGGPAFSLLRAAYAHASVSLSVMPSKPENVYRIVQVARSETFRRQLTELKNNLIAAEIAENVESLTQLIATEPAKCELLFVKAKST